MEQYLNDSEYIDWRHSDVLNKAVELAANCSSEEDIAKRCFLFVRDSIKHSWDYKLNPVTCKASDVLIHGTGYCYSKSHLLTALLRANGIPSGLCYQRLVLDIDISSSRFTLHGLNAVYLKQYGWYRLDARGNKPGVEAEFYPPVEKLAFPIIYAGERDLDGIFSEPLPSIIKVLTCNKTIEQVYENLPDPEIF
ncbi:MAG: transglutaminase family protein [Candidatus Acididesulfobacter diazotrophicus]|jgi:transglutaminase-like putative cysteine protease|uniref:Transglutaminase family protein n=1 Tax=Candidatus Acididesulfobacter diazotrophicus TaxID=2597226 RepID=A0A519BMM8_9DELT|nr:MAG: transglutaminase family protein [Candidatus Acididesulfobacter diazotrophicus]